MASKFEMEILNVNDDTGLPTAYSYHPSCLSMDALSAILRSQISANWPLEIHYYRKEEYPIVGVYRTIESSDFLKARLGNQEDREKFVKDSVEILKDLNTSEIIFAEPLIPKEN